MPTSLSRLQIAQQLYPLLQREIGHAIEIERLLGEPRYARDVLLVCDALPNAELRALAAQFRADAALPPAATAAQAPQALTSTGKSTGKSTASAAPDTPGHARQPTDWSRDTSGFGVSRPAPAGLPADTAPGTVAANPTAAAPRSSWLTRLTRW